MAVTQYCLPAAPGTAAAMSATCMMECSAGSRCMGKQSPRSFLQPKASRAVMPRRQRCPAGVARSAGQQLIVASQQPLMAPRCAVGPLKGGREAVGGAAGGDWQGQGQPPTGCWRAHMQEASCVRVRPSPPLPSLRVLQDPGYGGGSLRPAAQAANHLPGRRGGWAGRRRHVLGLGGGSQPRMLAASHAP